MLALAMLGSACTREVEGNKSSTVEYARFRVVVEANQCNFVLEETGIPNPKIVSMAMTDGQIRSGVVGGEIGLPILSYTKVVGKGCAGITQATFVDKEGQVSSLRYCKPVPTLEGGGTSYACYGQGMNSREVDG